MATINLTEEDIRTATENSSGSGIRQPLPAGDYNVVIEEIEEKTYGQNSSNRGRPYWNIRFKINGGPKDGRLTFGMVPLFVKWKSGAVAWQFKQFFDAVGVDFTAGQVELTPSEFVGKPLCVRLKVEPDTYAYNRAVSTYEDDVEVWEMGGGDPASKPKEPVQDDYKRNNIAAFKVWKESGTTDLPGVFEF